uniref:(northern house mosquito) hypothetical protein n=1 Tax=Culex pipiens TaxID=7175 RepID=A0A8D8GMM1_CULPI
MHARTAREDRAVSTRRRPSTTTQRTAPRRINIDDTPASVPREDLCTADLAPNTTIPPTVRPKRISTDRSTAETTARRTITTDRGDPWDGAAWDRPNLRHHHHATTTPATRLSTTRRRVTKFPRLNAIEITVRGATTVKRNQTQVRQTSSSPRRFRTHSLRYYGSVICKALNQLNPQRQQQLQPISHSFARIKQTHSQLPAPPHTSHHRNSFSHKFKL